MNTHAAPQAAAPGRLSGGPGVDAHVWGAFADPADRQQFLGAWLALMALRIAGAERALLLLQTDDGSYAPAAFWPQRSEEHKALLKVAEQAITMRRGAIEAGEDRRVRVAYPIEAAGQFDAVVVVEARETSASAVTVPRELHWGSGWLERLAWEEQALIARTSHARVIQALEAVATAGEHDRLETSALAVANQLAKDFAADRVSCGIYRRGRIRMAALSQAAWFERRTELVRLIETAMEEAFHQRATAQVPATEEVRSIAAAHRQLAQRFSSVAILSCVMEAEGRAIGVVTLERATGEAFTPGEREDVELICATLGPLMAARAREARLLSGRAPRWVARRFADLFGREHPALKVAASLTVVSLGLLALVPSTFRVSAPAVIEGTVQRAVVAPFEGFVRTAPVRAGDLVEEGQLMATLDDRDLRFENLKLDSERQKLMQRQRDAVARAERVNIQIVAAQISQTESELRLNEEKLARTRIVAPIAGLVVSGDLSQTLGTPVETGKILFEIVPGADFRAVLQIDDQDLPFIAAGQTGSLVLSALTGRDIPVTVTRITPITSNTDGRNTFRVEATFPDLGTTLKPGMEGVAKITVGEASTLWIWTRRTLARIRLFFWNWLP